MSILFVLKEKNALIFATDSRMMAHDFSGVASDAQQKIFEIAPGTFIATSGRAMVSDFQVARARELTTKLNTTDIQTIGAALSRESLPCLAELVERLRRESDATTKQHVSGESLLHGCMLVGRTAGGKLGYVLHSYRVREGTVQVEVEAYFDAGRKITFTSGGSAPMVTMIASRIAQNPATWTDPLEHVTRRFLETMKRSIPTIGGPWQMVRLGTPDGVRWISPPPEAIPLVGNLSAATISAAVSMTAPTLTITSGGTTINLDATNQFKISKSGFAQQIGTGLSSGFGTIDGFVATGSGSPAPLVTVSPLAVNIGSTSGTGTFYSALSQSGLFISNGAGSSTQADYSGITINGVHSIRARYGSTPVTLADLIALAQYHGLCV